MKGKAARAAVSRTVSVGADDAAAEGAAVAGAGARLAVGAEVVGAGVMIGGGGGAPSARGAAVAVCPAAAGEAAGVCLAAEAGAVVTGAATGPPFSARVRSLADEACDPCCTGGGVDEAD